MIKRGFRASFLHYREIPIKVGKTLLRQGKALNLKVLGTTYYKNTYICSELIPVSSFYRFL